MLLQRTENHIIGMFFGVNGEKFTIEEIYKKYSKHLSKIYQKANTSPKRELIVKQNNITYEPHEIMGIKLDLTKSSLVTNRAILEYLQFASPINRLLERSILDMETIFVILENNNYNNETTKHNILIYQNVFHSDFFVDSLNVLEKLKLFTENKYRTKEIMEKYRNEFSNCIYSLLEGFLLRGDIDLSENPSTLRNLIIATTSEFYNNDIAFTTEKEKALNNIRAMEDEMSNKVRVINVILDAIQKYKITETNWKDTKSSAIELTNNLLLTANEKLEKLNKKKEIVKYFPH